MKKLVTAVLLLLLSSWCLAQDEPEDTSVREILEQEEAVEEVIEEMEAEGEVLDMSTPLSSLLLLRQALEKEDYELAGQFLDMRYLPPELEGMEAIELLQQLRYVWGQKELLNVLTISDHSEGHQQDGLPAYRDKIGEVELRSGTVPIYMQQVPDGKGAAQGCTGRSAFP